ncbi:Hypothetical protein D9617_46g064310 [Elsinoe fawcettii]|nr:Hypothetical protein D9617_46g064310 [Elsinoe fawcettii]
MSNSTSYSPDNTTDSPPHLVKPPEEDWRCIDDPKERRRIQNRNAQRNHRWRINNAATNCPDDKADDDIGNSPGQSTSASFARCREDFERMRSKETARINQTLALQEVETSNSPSTQAQFHQSLNHLDFTDGDDHTSAWLGYDTGKCGWNFEIMILQGQGWSMVVMESLK